MKFGIDSKSGRLNLGKTSVVMPKSRYGRIAAGSLLVAGGLLGFLPVLGFWMLPLGIIVLSHDLHIVRRSRRRITIWWARRKSSSVPAENLRPIQQKDHLSPDQR
ncbi:hypothetical protein [Agrobacterium sp.]|jgi:hypothetical protein|uniref:hypothetical protein n=1 Tax=Agrobacterium sp. TaxID=361 RepID=UPI0028ACFDC3|nr:hypothetical protein [Agrobacterium sp.]